MVLSITSILALLCVYAVGSPASQRRESTRDGTCPPPGAIVVDKTGLHSNYTTVQSGINALSTTDAGLQSLFIYPGTYTEQVVCVHNIAVQTVADFDLRQYIPPRAANLTVYGYTRDSSSYHENEVNITYYLALVNVTHDDQTATVRAWSTNFKMYNVCRPVSSSQYHKRGCPVGCSNILTHACRSTSSTPSATLNPTARPWHFRRTTATKATTALHCTVTKTPFSPTLAYRSTHSRRSWAPSTLYSAKQHKPGSSTSTSRL